MIIEKQHWRVRIVKGYSFMALKEDELGKVNQFILTGDTTHLLGTQFEKRLEGGEEEIRDMYCQERR